MGSSFSKSASKPTPTPAFESASKPAPTPASEHASEQKPVATMTTPAPTPPATLMVAQTVGDLLANYMCDSTICQKLPHPHDMGMMLVAIARGTATYCPICLLGALLRENGTTMSKTLILKSPYFKNTLKDLLKSCGVAILDVDMLFSQLETAEEAFYWLKNRQKGTRLYAQAKTNWDRKFAELSASWNCILDMQVQNPTGSV